MTSLVDYIVSIAVYVIIHLQREIGFLDNPFLLYIACIFCFVCFAGAFFILLSLIPKLFLWVYNLFKRC